MGLAERVRNWYFDRQIGNIVAQFYPERSIKEPLAMSLVEEPHPYDMTFSWKVKRKKSFEGLGKRVTLLYRFEKEGVPLDLAIHPADVSMVFELQPHKGCLIGRGQMKVYAEDIEMPDSKLKVLANSVLQSMPQIEAINGIRRGPFEEIIVESYNLPPRDSTTQNYSKEWLTQGIERFVEAFRCIRFLIGDRSPWDIAMEELSGRVADEMNQLEGDFTLTSWLEEGLQIQPWSEVKELYPPILKRELPVDVWEATKDMGAEVWLVRVRLPYYKIKYENGLLLWFQNMVYGGHVVVPLREQPWVLDLDLKKWQYFLTGEVDVRIGVDPGHLAMSLSSEDVEAVSRVLTTLVKHRMSKGEIPLDISMRPTSENLSNLCRIANEVYTRFREDNPELFSEVTNQE
ncbi:hypothetical protein DRJ48_03665 [Candidatus Woesearchaeota archaeon]|nr:hypothetical protein [Candidatus Woesearchaeota archaeon]RLE42368.1 MAG: hypothetical protein DRJ48_03665 [Candidatus Woesearchaeota archaeon]